MSFDPLMTLIVRVTTSAKGPLASPIKRWSNVGTVVMVSGLMVGVSFVISSFVPNLAWMTLMLAGMAAPAIGISNILTRELIGQCFTKSHTRAFGIAASGGSFAFVVFAPLTQFFLDAYGWRGTMMLIGVILSHLTVCGARLRKKPAKPRKTDRKGSYGPLPSSLSGKEKNTNFWRPWCHLVRAFVSDTFHLKLFATSGYWLIVVISICTTTMCTTWVVYLAPNSNQSKRFLLSDAAIFAAVFGVGKIVGNLVAGLFDKCKAIGSNAWMAGAVIGSSICFFIDPWMTSYRPIMVYVFIYGCFHSFVYTLLDVITKQTVGVDFLGSAFAWIGLKGGIVRAMFLFFPGLIYDIKGSYTLAFILMCCINALALPALIALAWTQRRKSSEQQHT